MDKQNEITITLAAIATTQFYIDGIDPNMGDFVLCLEYMCDNCPIKCECTGAGIWSDYMICSSFHGIKGNKVCVKCQNNLNKIKTRLTHILYRLTREQYKDWSLFIGRYKKE